MRDFEDYYYLGKIYKPNGYRGKVNAWLDVDQPSAYESMQMVFLDIHGTLVPYFIENIQVLNNKAVILFQDFDSIEKAERVNNAEMYLPLSDLPELTGNKFYYHEVIGFLVIDKQKGKIGTIHQVFDYPSQAVMQVYFKGKEVLVPINPNVILQVDREKKEILIDAPEGLIELYLT